MDQLNNVFDVGYCAHPTLFDIDNDNDLDLIVGEAIGNLNYLENIGDSTTFNFELVSETLGQVDVSEWWTNIGSSTPQFKIINQKAKEEKCVYLEMDKEISVITSVFYGFAFYHSF